jgi:hypothetical protein
MRVQNGRQIMERSSVERGPRREKWAGRRRRRRANDRVGKELVDLTFRGCPGGWALYIRIYLLVLIFLSLNEQEDSV